MRLFEFTHGVHAKPERAIRQRRSAWLAVPMVAAIIATALLHGCADALVAEKDQDIPQTLQVGREYRGEVDIAPVRIALPDGSWTVMAAESLYLERYGLHFLARRGALGRIVPSPWSRRELGGMVYFEELTSRSTTVALLPDLREAAWEGCNALEQSGDFHFFHRFAEGGAVIGCWSVDFIDLSKNNKRNVFAQADATLNESIDKLNVEAGRFQLRDQLKAFVAQREIRVPKIMAQVHFSGAIRTRLINVSYFFNPDLGGIEPASEGDWLLSDWNVRNIGQFPEKKRYMDGLNDWGEGWQYRFERGFNRF